MGDNICGQSFLAALLQQNFDVGQQFMNGFVNSSSSRVAEAAQIDHVDHESIFDEEFCHLDERMVTGM
jgi:hypothetical protein